MINLRTKILIYFPTYICINSCAQENQIMKINSLSTIEEDVNFYDALRQRTDLNFGRNIRILYTSIKNLEEFQKNYQDSDMYLDYVIRNRLHTAIYLNQKKNYLESMDGSMFNLTVSFLDIQREAGSEFIFSFLGNKIKSLLVNRQIT